MEIGMKVLLAVLVVAMASTTAGFVVGKNKGINDGYASASSDYNLWSVGMMNRDPSFRLDAIVLVPDRARVRVPKCDADEALSAIAWRRPEQGYKASASLKRDGDSIVVSIPRDSGSVESRAAVAVGCRKKVEPQVKDLTKSWELPSNLR
jgi:hypothetical protein